MEPCIPSLLPKEGLQLRSGRSQPQFSNALNLSAANKELGLALCHSYSVCSHKIGSTGCQLGVYLTFIIPKLDVYEMSKVSKRSLESSRKIGFLLAIYSYFEENSISPLSIENTIQRDNQPILVPIERQSTYLFLFQSFEESLRLCCEAVRFHAQVSVVLGMLDSD